MGKSLIAFDTDHIKGYVFATDKLKEIRGASALLDFLNRTRMRRWASEFGARCIYANGGSGLFVVNEDNADEFGCSIQKEYKERSQGSASITYAIQPVPDLPLRALLTSNIPNELELLRWRLREKKDCPFEVVALPSHPFIKPCDSCGIENAEDRDIVGDRDEDEEDRRYCGGCLAKREEDRAVKKRITHIIERLDETGIIPKGVSLWDRLIAELHKIGYEMPRGTERPGNFNDFRHFSEGMAKGYLGLIYADANGMSKKLAELQKLAEVEKFAEIVDDGVYRALAKAIKEHTHVIEVEDVDGKGEKSKTPLFPFDVLLIGGDDIVIVTHASVAMQVASTMAQEFCDWTRRQEQQPGEQGTQVKEKKGQTLSVGVVLAPIKYPFGLLLDLVEDTLINAKKKGSDSEPDVVYGDTCINFMTVTGNTSQRFKDVYEDFLQREDLSINTIFYATLRPYTLSQMQSLLDLIGTGGKLKLGRTKLHQIREAILEKNLTTSVVEGLSLLRNWKEEQRSFVIRRVYPLGRPNEVEPQAAQALSSEFAQVTFPWYFAGSDSRERLMYRTPLLDFVELYDFVGSREIPNDNEN